MKYYLAIKRYRLLTNGTTWMNLKCMTLSERNQSQRATYCRIPFIQHSCKGKALQKTGHGCWVYSFPRTTVTKYHKLGGLKPQRLVLLQFQGQKSDMSVGKAALPQKFPKDKLSLASSSFCGSLLGVRPHHSSLCLCGHISSSSACLPLSYKGCDGIQGPPV